ncbi:MFS transporter [Namhaeicola litoreus]|uniref:MFS transporter n=1 Tax=Namhaeicola litoreus TaxID=1052145 RepID=A0ABW3Y2W9_9FLAO
MNLEKGDKKLLNSWAFYDWANSVYSLVISTAIFPIYYESVTQTESGLVNFFGTQFNNTTLYTYSLSISFLIVALISPLLSGIADYVGNKKSYLKGFCYLGSISVMMLYFFNSLDTLWVGLLFSILASIGFWGSLVFYNAYLPEIAYKDQQDKVSAKGFIYGYLGSVLLLIFNLSMVMKPEWYGITSSTLAPRISFLLVGLWWIGFAQVTFKNLPEGNYNAKRNDKNLVFKGYRELRKVVNELYDQPVLLNFLASFFLYSIGVQTVILVATIYGKTEIGLSTSSLILTIIMIQIVGIAGAYLFSRLSGKIGNVSTLKITILIWCATCYGAYLLQPEDPFVTYKFFGLGFFIGLVLGAIQTLSRSTYSKLLPETKDNTTYFSFFDVTEKLAIVWGTFVFGLVLAITESMRVSILLITLFFFVSLIVLSFIKRKDLS